MNTYLVQEILKEDEGYRQMMYLDTMGIPTIGYGRNLRDRGVTQEEATYLLSNDIAASEQDCERNFAFWWTIPSAAQDVLVCLAFNMGISKLQEFHKTLAHIEKGEWQEAGNQLLQSRWAHQVGVHRSHRMADMLRNCGA